MYSKLTLNVDGTVIRESKKYANKHHVSLSKIVGKYLKQITSSSEAGLSTQNKTIIDEISGVLSDISRKDIKTAKYDYLKKKHGL